MSSQPGSHEDMSEEKFPERAHEHDRTVAVADSPFTDPGLPPHEPRRQDIDERAARRSERAVALLFTISMLATIGFIASYVIFPIDKIVYIFPFGHVSALNFALGLTLGLALFCIGAGAVHWARALMADEEVPQERHPIEAAPEVKAQVLADFKQGAKESQLGRRKLIRTTMFGALALVPLSGLVLLRDLGPLPEDKLRHTAWRKGLQLINMNTNQPLRPEDIQVGSLTFAQPQGFSEDDPNYQTELAKAALMLVRLHPKDIKDKRELDWSHDGIVAFSKICTHVGCPISLYEQQTHHVLCPCHQSTFDLGDSGIVVFGPAARALPQLPITTDADGYLVARSGFTVPTGPSFFERDSRHDFKRGDN